MCLARLRVSQLGSGAPSASGDAVEHIELPGEWNETRNLSISIPPPKDSGSPTVSGNSVSLFSKFPTECNESRDLVVRALHHRGTENTEENTASPVAPHVMRGPEMPLVRSMSFATQRPQRFAKSAKNMINGSHSLASLAVLCALRVEMAITLYVQISCALLKDFLGPASVCGATKFNNITEFTALVARVRKSKVRRTRMNTDQHRCWLTLPVRIRVHHLLSVFFRLVNKRVDLILREFDPGYTQAYPGDAKF